ncbi:MAG: type I restriction endonuclease, partial [Spirochaetia bacterium]
MSKYNEAAFESAIEVFLMEQGGFTSRKNRHFDRDLCLDTEVFIDFVKATQPKEWDYLFGVHKNSTTSVLVEDLVRALNSEHEGCLDVLRHGFKCYGKLIRTAFFAPASGMNPETKRLYDANILTITRQAHFSNKHDQSVDIVLTINGIPVATLELKNPMTGQTWRNAVHQYKTDRDPNDTLFAFRKRALVHFAVDTAEAYMTTRLSGATTSFLPFNKGRDKGAGNPDNPKGYKTAYLWEEVLARDSLMDIVARFLHIQVEDKKIGNKVVRKESMIFPRYHQLECVRELVQTAKIEGAGHNYLVQHSAGSGKSNSIAWLAHRLASLHDNKDEKVFSSVVVITDRVVLDQQLQNTIYQFEHKAGVVRKIDVDSAQLADALNTGTPIIITTLQKFPYVLGEVGEHIQSRKYAVIVDEAHSSMGGETAAEMKGVLGASGQDDQDETSTYPDQEDEIIKAMGKRGQQPNLSFFAFTATPKYKTLEVFGTPGADGSPEPFHLYSMRQAIEEGFILDVLEHYTTYKTYYRIVKSIEDDPKLDKRKAAAALARFVSLHPHNIAQKTEVIIEHFRNHSKHKIGRLAKAMVVARSRLHAVRYKMAFDDYIKAKGYAELRTLVAFSGEVSDGVARYTEVGFNKFGEKELPEKFALPDYCVLIVAEKYQTGFDQPLLHSMYIDKRLAGIQAIQTLSRLNRICPGKEDTFVLDFVNQPEEIQEAFQPYYEKTIVGERVDYKKLYEIQTKLASYQVYFTEEVEEFCRFFFASRRNSTTGDHANMNKILDVAVGRFVLKPDDEKEEIRKT